MSQSDDPRRRLPAVETLLKDERLSNWCDRISPAIVADEIRTALQHARSEIEKGKPLPPLQAIVDRIDASLHTLANPTLKPVINATGVVLHTGLGRAPLAKEAAQAVIQAAGYCVLEYDLKTSERGDRQEHVESLLCRLTGAESALVVNNNAAAVYLTLSALGFRKEVVVSRGQLIEIGGSFRLPDIMARSGAKLVEVGATNRTRIEDYREAITGKTALLMRAHPSNFRIEGFTESVAIDQLVELGRQTSVPVVEDLGNGLLWDWSDLGLPSEENVRASLQAGANLVLISGDKVLGGPQAGIILGDRDLIRRIKRHPLARVLRAEKLTLAALAATLRLFLDHRQVCNRVPVWQMISQPVDAVRARARVMHERIQPLNAWRRLEVVDSQAEAGSGTLPAVPLPSAAVVALPASFSAASFARRLRQAAVPVIAAVRQDAVWLDMRTVADDQLDELARSIAASLEK